MPLARPGSASLNTASQFYKTFYTWSRLFSAQSSQHEQPPRSHHPRTNAPTHQPRRRNYATFNRIVVSHKQPDKDKSSEKRPTSRTRIHTKTSVLSLTESHNLPHLTPAILTQITAKACPVKIDITPTIQDGGERGLVRVIGTMKQTDAALTAVKTFLNQDFGATAEAFRLAMRSVPYPVAVLTTSQTHEFSTSSSPTSPVNPQPDDQSPPTAPAHPVSFLDPRLRGMTISSLTPITLSPYPIMSLNIKRPSRTLSALLSNPHFNIHLPAPNSTGRAIASAFASAHADPIEPFLALHKRRDVALRTNRGVPFLKGRGVLLRFACRVLRGKTVEVGDHDVVFAAVEEVFRFDDQGRVIQEGEKGEKGDATSAGAAVADLETALAYARGKYCRVQEMAVEEDGGAKADSPAAAAVTAQDVSTTSTNDSAAGDVATDDAVAASAEDPATDESISALRAERERQVELTDRYFAEAAEEVSSPPHKETSPDDMEATVSSDEERKAS